MKQPILITPQGSYFHSAPLIFNLAKIKPASQLLRLSLCLSLSFFQGSYFHFAPLIFNLAKIKPASQLLRLSLSVSGASQLSDLYLSLSRSCQKKVILPGLYFVILLFFPIAYLFPSCASYLFPSFSSPTFLVFLPIRLLLPTKLVRSGLATS